MPLDIKELVVVYMYSRICTVPYLVRSSLFICQRIRFDRVMYNLCFVNYVAKDISNILFYFNVDRYFVIRYIHSSFYVVKVTKAKSYVLATFLANLLNDMSMVLRVVRSLLVL